MWINLKDTHNTHICIDEVIPTVKGLTQINFYNHT